MRYEDLLKDPRWQKRRLEIMQRDNFTCQHCGNGLNDGISLNVHHIRYRRNLMPWEYDDTDLTTLCEKCHKEEHSAKTKANRNLYKVGKGKLVFFRNLLKEERLTPDDKIILSYVLTHETANNKRLSEILNINRKTVISSMKKIKELRLIEQKSYIFSGGYFELTKLDILKGDLLIFYSFLKDKSSRYGYCIDTFKAKIGEQTEKSKIAITKLLNRLYEKKLAKRLSDGKLQIYH